MRKSIVLPLLSLTVFSCRITQPVPSSVGLVPLSNYFVKNKPQLTEDVNYMAISTSTVFYNTFGIAKTMDNEVREPNFSGQVVIAVAMKPTNKNVAIKFSKAEIVGRHLNVSYTVSESTTPLSYTQTPLALATVPKSQNVKDVQFYFKDSKIASVEIQ